MSIDYDELREWLSTVERENHGRDGVMEFTHPGNTVEIIRELVRLRDGVEQVADDLGANAEYAPNIPTQTAYRVAEQLLTDLLNGDTNE